MSRALFDRDYWTRIREQLHAGVPPPLLHGKLLAYAYGEPQHERSGNGGTHISIGFLSTAAPDVTVNDVTVEDVTSPAHLALSGGE